MFRTYERMGDMLGGRDLLISAIEHSQGSAYWHCRLTFQLAQLHADPQVLDYQSAHHVLQTVHFNMQGVLGAGKQSLEMYDVIHQVLPDGGPGQVCQV